MLHLLLRAVNTQHTPSLVSPARLYLYSQRVLCTTAIIKDYLTLLIGHSEPEEWNRSRKYSRSSVELGGHKSRHMYTATPVECGLHMRHLPTSEGEQCERRCDVIMQCSAEVTETSAKRLTSWSDVRDYPWKTSSDLRTEVENNVYILKTLTILLLITLNSKNMCG